MLWFLPMAVAAAPCDETALGVVIDALDTAPDDAVAMLTASDLADLCTFDSPIQDALRAVAAGEPPDDDALREALSEACPDLPKSPSRRALWRRCELEGLGLFTREDWLAANGPSLLPLLVHEALREGEITPPTTQVVTRRLAGIPRTSVPGVVNTFEPLFPTFP